MLLNTAPITPARPKLAKTRPFPKLRSRVGKVLNVALGETGLGRLRVGRVNYRYASGFTFPAALRTAVLSSM
jgi:hypothetical protein